MESDEEGDWWSRTRRRKNQAPMVERSVIGWERDHDEVSLKNIIYLKNSLGSGPNTSVFLGSSLKIPSQIHPFKECSCKIP